MRRDAEQFADGLTGFLTTVAEIARVPVEAVGPDTRLLEDLSLDSLELSEVLLALVTEHELGSLSDPIRHSNWKGVTVGELYNDYVANSRPGLQLQWDAEGHQE